MRVLRLLAACAGLSVVTPCWAEGEHVDPTADWMPRGINWQNAETIVIQMGDHLFEPDEITFKINKPYRLILNNISDQHKHDLVDQAFFHSIVLDKVVVGGVEVNTPHVHSLMLKPNSTTSLYMVPMKPAEYEIFCSVPGHREDGMEAWFVIQE